MKLASSKRGAVYVLTNPAMPGLVKIGCTKYTADERARRLSSETGVPAPFVVAWEWPVSDWYSVEQLTHNRLGLHRPNGNREFFTCSVKQASREITRVARAYMRPAWLRLLIGPRRRRQGPPVYKRSRPVRANLTGPVLAMAALVGLLAWLKPAPAPWLPDSVRVTVALVERL
jgi:hypothetical protein